MTWQPVTADSPPRGRLVIIQTGAGVLMFASRYNGGWRIDTGLGARHVPLRVARVWMDAPERYEG